ncbi:MAG: hypothetical protein M1453_06210 [Acidobacteria bacterium]|nr:hypothetical protein [Acidobacteriota bacterium]MCL5287572.1 hypothetical protein [Acidobacteriota bacterium]
MTDQDKAKKPKNEKTPLSVENEESRKAPARIPLPAEPVGGPTKSPSEPVNG